MTQSALQSTFLFGLTILLSYLSCCCGQRLQLGLRDCVRPHNERELPHRLCKMSDGSSLTSNRNSKSFSSFRAAISISSFFCNVPLSAPCHNPIYWSWFLAIRQKMSPLVCVCSNPWPRSSLDFGVDVCAHSVGQRFCCQFLCGCDSFCNDNNDKKDVRTVR